MATACGAVLGRDHVIARSDHKSGSGRRGGDQHDLLSVMRAVTIMVPAAELDSIPPTESWPSWHGEASKAEGALSWLWAGAMAVEISKRKRAASAWAARLAHVQIPPLGILLITARAAARVP